MIDWLHDLHARTPLVLWRALSLEVLLALGGKQRVGLLRRNGRCNVQLGATELVYEWETTRTHC